MGAIVALLLGMLVMLPAMLLTGGFTIHFDGFTSLSDIIGTFKEMFADFDMNALSTDSTEELLSKLFGR